MTTAVSESALTGRVFGEARVLVQQRRNLSDEQKTSDSPTSYIRSMSEYNKTKVTCVKLSSI